MKRRRLAGASVLALGATLAFAHTPQTLASWTDSEHTTGAFTAGSVSPPTSLACSAGLLTNVRFTWAAPASGLTPSGYIWTTFSHSESTTETSVTLSPGLLTLGTSTFSVVATSGGWTSTPVTGTLSVLGVLGIPVTTDCSVP